MSLSVELVLEIDPKSVAQWLRERKPARRRGTQRHGGGQSASAVVADALACLRGVAVIEPREALSMRVWQRGDASMRVVLEEASERRRLWASYASTFVPGLTLRNTVCDVPLEADAPSTTNEALPPELRAAIDVAGGGMRSASMLAYRMLACWHEPGGRAIDIALLDSGDAGPSTKGEGAEQEAGARMPSAFCELHLSVRCGEAQAGSRDEAWLAPACEALFEAARMLVDRLPGFPALTDAYAHATGDTTGDEPVRASRVDLTGARTPHAAVIAIGANVARQWFGNERGIRGEDSSEFVHQMRVAMRRAKTLTKVFPRWADDVWQGRVAPGIEWLGDMLGETRDLDVFVDTTLPVLASADTDASTWSAAVAAAEERRLAAHGRLQHALRERRHGQLSLAWLEWLAKQRLCAGPARHAGRSLRAYAAKRVRRHFERLTGGPSLHLLDAAARHRRRIEAKRLRYTLEFFGLLVSSRTRRKTARQLARIQDVLGEGFDAATALRFVEESDLTPYRQGFARGWCQAVDRDTAREGERLIRKLRKPRIVRGK